MGTHSGCVAKFINLHLEPPPVKSFSKSLRPDLNCCQLSPSFSPGLKVETYLGHLVKGIKHPLLIFCVFPRMGHDDARA